MRYNDFLYQASALSVASSMRPITPIGSKIFRKI